MKLRHFVKCYFYISLSKFRVMGKVSPKTQAFILKLYETGYIAKKNFNEYSRPDWKYGGVRQLVKKIRKTESINRQEGSGRPRSSNNVSNTKKNLKLAVSRQTVRVCICRFARFNVKRRFLVPQFIVL